MTFMDISTFTHFSILRPKGRGINPKEIKNAKKIVGRQYDVYGLEAEWKDWWEKTGKPELKSPDGAFINFCKKRMLG